VEQTTAACQAAPLRVRGVSLPRVRTSRPARLDVRALQFWDEGLNHGQRTQIR
jgi:hypothetical protein